MADSMRYPIGRFSPKLHAYIRYPAPRHFFASFAAAVTQACHDFRIDVIVPTSEETFWVSMVETLPAHTCLRTSSLSVLHTLHNKWTFAKLALSLHYGIADTQLIASETDLHAFVQKVNLDEYVLKPVYSRFAATTLIGPTRKQMRHIKPSRDRPWIAQQRIRGTEFCLYNLAEAGELLLHVAYQPIYRAGKGAGVYFEPVDSKELRSLAAAFIAATRFTGQISFDVIKTDSALHTLECNPRGTSGAHLLAQHPRAFERALLGHDCLPTNASQPTMLLLPLMLYHPLIMMSRLGLGQLCRAQDAMRSAGISITAQLAALFEMFACSAKRGQGLLTSATSDIEWNGECRPETPEIYRE